MCRKGGASVIAWRPFAVIRQRRRFVRQLESLLRRSGRFGCEGRIVNLPAGPVGLIEEWRFTKRKSWTYVDPENRKSLFLDSAAIKSTSPAGRQVENWGSHPKKLVGEC